MNFLWRIKKSGFIEVTAILAAALLIRTYGYGLYRVPSASMEKTMLAGELFFSNKVALLFSSPTHGDVIAFNDPTYVYSSNPMIRTFEQHLWGPENWSKRVIGIPGDTIQGKIEWEKPVIYRNGKKLAEKYLKEYPYHYDGSDIFNVTLNADQFWVMGDNRSNSYDSRSFGPLDGRLIHGKIVYRLFSIDRIGAWLLIDLVTNPVQCWKLIRWERCMEKVV